jgi:hypothetical protein
MAKEPVTPPEVSDEDEVFGAFGIEDDNAKKRVRELSAARVLAHRKLNPKTKKKTETEDSGNPWGKDSAGE